jgi:DNA polymerase-3 subunit delta
MATKPVIYLLHGDDEYAIAQQIEAMKEKLGDPANADLNTTDFSQDEFDLDAVVSAAQAMPFLADRRLVVIHDPLSHFKSASLRDRFKKFLETIPETTALVIAVTHPLVNYKDKKRGKKHWLQKWAQGQKGRVYEKELVLPRGSGMNAWIQNQTRSAGGEITPQAAALLASLVGEEPRVAMQEIEKLLAYVNYNRPIEPDDVQHLVTGRIEGDVFAMVDALGHRNGQKALEMLHRLLEQDDPLRLFGMIVRQFRLLLMARELLDSGYRANDLAGEMSIHPFVAKKLVPQTHNFSLESLERIYRQLLDIDEAIKTGKIESEVALTTLTTALTL